MEIVKHIRQEVRRVNWGSPIIQYVVVHELVHLIEPHHSNEFWYRMKRIVPNFSDRKHWLAEDGATYDL